MEQNKSTKAVVFKVLNITLNVLFYIFIAFMLVFSIANIRVKTSLDIPNIFGRGFLSVQSDSMKGTNEDSFLKGDLIFVRMLDQEDLQDLQIGDIITYEYSEPGAGRFLNTHRIVDISDDYSTFTTQGDFAAQSHPYNPDETVPDEDRTFEYVSANQIKAVYTSDWSGVGKALDYIQTPSGFAFTIVLPTAILFGLELFFLIRNIMIVNRQKLQLEQEKENLVAKEELQKQLEKEREEMRKQILEELKKEEKNNQ